MINIGFSNKKAACCSRHICDNPEYFIHFCMAFALKTGKFVILPHASNRTGLLSKKKPRGGGLRAHHLL